jgi:hypothetical protein
MLMNFRRISNLFILTFVFFSSLNCISQELQFGKLLSDGPLKKYNSYLASDGNIYKAGDKIKIGFPFSACNSSFCFCSSSEGKLGVGSSSQVVEIAYFQVYGNVNTGFFVRMYTDWGGISRYYVFEFENALKTKELLGKGMTSDEAILELKKEKEKLDLQIITQEEYDKRKNELMKYIN